MLSVIWRVGSGGSDVSVRHVAFDLANQYYASCFVLFLADRIRLHVPNKAMPHFTSCPIKCIYLALSLAYVVTRQLYIDEKSPVIYNVVGCYLKYFEYP